MTGMWGDAVKTCRPPGKSAAHVLTEEPALQVPREAWEDTYCRATWIIAGDHARTMPANAAASPPRRETISRLEEETIEWSPSRSPVSSVQTQIRG